MEAAAVIAYRVSRAQGFTEGNRRAPPSFWRTGCSTATVSTVRDSSHVTIAPSPIATDLLVRAASGLDVEEASGCDIGASFQPRASVTQRPWLRPKTSLPEDIALERAQPSTSRSRTRNGPPKDDRNTARSPRQGRFEMVLLLPRLATSQRSRPGCLQPTQGAKSAECDPNRGHRPGIRSAPQRIRCPCRNSQNKEHCEFLDDPFEVA